MNELNIPEHWAECKIGDLFEVISGSTPSTGDASNYSDNEIPWVTPADLSNIKGNFISRGRRDISEKGFKSCSTRMLPKNSILYSSRAPIGHIAIAENDICTNQGFKSLSIRDLSFAKFVYYYLKNITPLIQSKGSGTTFKEVSSTAFKDLPFILPPKSEQERIVQKIESCFQKINETEKTLNDVDVMISKLSLSFLMKSGEWLEPTKLREITLERVEKIGIKAPKLRKIGVDNKLGVVDLRVTGLNTFEKYKIVRQGDILYNPMRANVGSLALYLDEEDAITSPDYIVFSVNKGASKWLVFKFLKSSQGQVEIAKKLKGSVRERLYYNKLADINFSSPPPDISLMADKFLDMLYLSIQQKRQTLEKLISGARGSILTKAFEGVLVPRIEKEGTGHELLVKIRNTKLEISSENNLKIKSKSTNKKKVKNE